MTFDLSKIDRDAQLLDIDRINCEESLYEFYRGAWPYIDSAPWIDGWCMEAVAEHLEAVCYGEIRRLIINISPRCSKSNLVSVSFPAWVWAQSEVGPISGPGVAFLHASYAHQLSIRDSVKCRRLIESPWYQKRWNNRFGLTTDQNTKSRFTNNKGGENLITSVDGTNTGEGGMCFVAGTRISTPGGCARIEYLRPGDSVWGFDLQREMVVTSHVIAVAKRKSNDLCTLREVSGNSITCTQDHRVYSPGRGFVRADCLGKGDWLLVSGAECESNVNIPASDMRQLRKAPEETPVSAAQGTQTGKPGLLLQQTLPKRPSLNQELTPDMQGMWQRSTASTSAILFRKMQTGARKLGEKTATYLQILRQRISSIRHQSSILFKKMRGRWTFQENERIGELQISEEARTGTVFESFPSDSHYYPSARRTLLCELWKTCRESQVELPPKNFSSSSSRRRESSQQQTGESDNSLREVPSPSPYWYASQIIEISRHGGATHDVYDIQVEETNNFFAEGILVHNCILIDDPNSVDDVDSEASIQTTIDWWTGTMPTRLNNQETGAYVVIQQRTFENDLTGHILETEGEDWVHLMIPMRYEPERSFHTVIGWKDPRTEAGQLMWPERFSDGSVTRLEKRLGPFRAAGQLQQRPEPAGGGIIKREWWKLWEHDAYPPMDFVIATLDGAYTEDRLNDASGMIVWGIFSGDVKATTTQLAAPNFRGEIVTADGKPFIRPDSSYSEFAPHVMCMYAWDDRLELHELVVRVAQTCIRMKVDLLLIENKASGISVSQEIRRLYSREKFGVELFDPKSQDKAARLYSVQHLFAEGIIYGPDRSWMERVITQVGQFPKGRADEYVDLTSMGLRKLRDMGLLVRQPEREAENEARKVYPRGQDEPLYPG